MCHQKQAFSSSNRHWCSTSSSTEDTSDNIIQILNYVDTYPNAGIVYFKSNMVLAAHSDAGFHNETKGHRRAGAHIFLSENELEPRWNGPVLTIAKNIKFVMNSAA